MIIKHTLLRSTPDAKRKECEETPENEVRRSFYLTVINDTVVLQCLPRKTVIITR